MSSGDRYDVVVVGGGPAGLSAALVLGRARLRVALVDAGEGRNAAARELHAYLGREGASPAELRRSGQQEIAQLGVESISDRARGIAREASGYRVELAGGRRLRGRRLLLATGIVDPLPGIAGIEALYGTSVHHCPFCDGWEQRDRALAVLGAGAAGARFAVKMTRWSRDVVLLTNGPSRLRLADRKQLARFRIAVRSDAIAALEGEGGQLRRVLFAEGEPMARDALFFVTRPRQRSDLAVALGCQLTRHGMVQADHRQATCVPGVYAAGDACRDVKLAVVAAAEGAKAAVAIVDDLERARLAG